MKELLEEAFRIAILTEKSSYDLYRDAAATLPDGNAKQVLERLATEELSLIEEIVKYCPINLARTPEQPNAPEAGFDGNSRESPELMLFDHLRTALLDKQSCIDRYATFVCTLREPALCRIFELALSLSRRQFDMIAQHYAEADLRLHRPAVDRRAKRAHIRVGSRRAPNKHSQLYISLLDSGRCYPF